MRTFVTPLFGKAKVKLSQTPRAVTPFGGLASFIAFLDQIGYAQKVRAHLPWQLTSPNAIPLDAHVDGVCDRRDRRGAPFCATRRWRGPTGHLHALLGLERWPGADTVRGLFHRFSQATIQSFWRPMWIWLLGLVRCPAGGFSLGSGFDGVPAGGTPARRGQGLQSAPAGAQRVIIRCWRCWRRCRSCCTAGCAAATPARRAGQWPSCTRRWRCCRKA